MTLPSSLPLNPVHSNGTYSSSSDSVTITTPAYVVSVAPSISTESTQAVGGPRPYPSPVCCDRTWSTGVVDKLCAAVPCGFTADNLRSVVAHYNKTHDRDTVRRFPEVPFKTEEIVPKARKVPTLADLINDHGRRLYATLERHYEDVSHDGELHEAHHRLLADHEQLQARCAELQAQHAELHERYDALLAKATRWLES